ncbi:uncharacterized protein [Rutidosis leptorrhynchoides]|uniref:uncharacterized protein n=1 Tax=Rutidosis leptorrhynchoides TaxID=125765 RepID=UPI003A98F9BC
MIPQITPPPIPNPLPPTLPCMDLVQGPRLEYLKIGVPLYEASIKCDWKAAKAILDEKKELVRYSITENGETALHVAASAKGDPKLMVDFVKNLVDMMDNKDLELQNKNHNTALYLAAVAGNVETVKIMMERNRVLLTIAGAGAKMLPLYAAVLFGHYDVANYIYENSNLDDDCWTPENRRWLFEKCVDNEIFDIALRIREKRPEVASNGSTLVALARKPNVFIVPKSNVIWRFFIWVFAFFGLKMGAPEKETKAMLLLRKIWEDIAKKPKVEIDNILRGPKDSIKKENKSWSVQATRLQVLISKHVAKMKVETNSIISRLQESSNKVIELQTLITKYLEDMHDETHNIIRSGPIPMTKPDNKTSYGKEYQARELNNLISTHIVSMHGQTHNLIKKIRNEDQLIQKLKEVIHKCVDDLGVESQKILPKPEKDTYSSRVLFIAAEVGNASFLIELIHQYPDLIWKVNDNNQTIFHIAVKHRHEGIYNLLYEIGSMKDMITPLKDENDNNMLHLVGNSAKRKRLQDVSGVALQMQRELLWFQEVEGMIPPSYRERKNKDGLTPYELFTDDHKELVAKGEQWMKETANQCMVVAALIATIVFAAAFTVPGGYNQNTGIPFFISKATFMVFVVSDAISLFSSSASILMFLSILTSRYAERDFLESLPRKLILGLLTLFLSIATMTLAFSVSFFVLYHKGLLWIPILIGVFAVIPVFLYVMLQYGLFFDVIRSTYRSRYLFKPTKRTLYYENPKV